MQPAWHAQGLRSLLAPAALSTSATAAALLVLKEHEQAAAVPPRGYASGFPNEPQLYTELRHSHHKPLKENEEGVVSFSSSRSQVPHRTRARRLPRPEPQHQCEAPTPDELATGPP